MLFLTEVTHQIYIVMTKVSFPEFHLEQANKRIFSQSYNTENTT